MEKDSGIKKNFGKVTVDSVKEDQFKPGMGSAQIRQTVTKTYPASSIGNDKTDNLFGTEELGIEDGKSFESTRVTWIQVPLDATLESVQAKLDACQEARIYQILSSEAILHDGQVHAIEVGIRPLEEFENSQLIKDSDGNVVLYNDAEQYSARFFSANGKEDIDLRDAEKAPAAANAMAAGEKDLAS